MYNLQEIIDLETKRVIEVYNDFKKNEIDPIADVGNPEEIIGKPYEQWTPQDIQKLQSVYVYDIEPLEKFVASKEIDKLFKTQELTRQLEG